MGLEWIAADLSSGIFGYTDDEVNLAGFGGIEPNAMIYVVGDDEIPGLIEAEMLGPVDPGFCGRAAVTGIALFARL